MMGVCACLLAVVLGFCLAWGFAGFVHVVSVCKNTSFQDDKKSMNSMFI